MLSENQRNKIILQQRKDRYTYLGMLSEYQIIASDLRMYKKLNPKQHFLFKRVLHGLKMYDEVQVSKMHWDKKRRITKVWKRAQHVINELKQFVSYRQVQPIFRIFTKSQLGKGIHEMPFEYLPDYKNKMTLQELGLTYEDVILKFMGVGLLPKNYLSVK